VSVTRRMPHGGQAGGLLIEVLVSLVVFSFGLLGYTAMQARGAVAEFEALQRSQALVLVEDMVSRLNANRANAGDYVSADLIGDGDVVDCAALSGAALDLCEWGNLIRGNTETRNAVRIGSMTAARGCIARAADASDRYTVSIAWQGVAATAAPPSSCGQGDAAFPTEALRRTVAVTVCIAQLRDPAAPPALPRC
jgi:type IV pilus assembly protein PilV